MLRTKISVRKGNPRGLGCVQMSMGTIRTPRATGGLPAAAGSRQRNRLPGSC